MVFVLKNTEAGTHLHAQQHEHESEANPQVKMC